MAILDWLIKPADEAGKLHEGKPQKLKELFTTYLDVQRFYDSYGQMLKTKFNGFLNEIGLSLEHIADIGMIDNAKALVDGFDLNTLKAQGIYKVYNPTNSPLPNSADSIIVFNKVISSTLLEQEIVFTYSDDTSRRGNKFSRVLVTGTWGSWDKIAITNKIDILSTDLKNGWSMLSGYPSVLRKEGNSLILSMNLIAGVVANNTPIYTLPPNCRPKESIGACFINALKKPFAINAYYSGDISFVDIGGSVLTGENCTINMVIPLI